MASFLHPEDELAGVFAAVAEASDDAIIVKDLDGIVRSWNPAAERLYGYAAEEVIGRSVSLIVPPDRVAELASIMGRIKDGQRVDRHETVRYAKGARAVHVSLAIEPIRDVDGTVIGAAVVSHDLTLRKSAETALRTSEGRWRSIVESAVDGIIVIDAHGRVEGVNPAAERLFGYTEPEIIGRNVNVLMPSPYHEEHDGYLARYVATGQKKIIGVGREVTARRKDGSTFPIHLSVGEMAGGPEPKFTGILHDLSARVRIEEQLREQSAMAHLGEMAAVIAHEVKNPLAGIRGAVQVIGGRLPADGRDAAVALEIVKRIDGLNDLMKDLLLFARPPHAKPAAVDVGELVSLTAGLLAQDPSATNIRVQIDGVAPPIMADAELLKIVFVNLLMNGAHAMEGRGVIHVSIGTTAGMCRIAFHDAGPGIPPEVREKVFTPFFTTKSKGTGLGLPTAKRLIDAHAGAIEIECPPGGGTRVTVQLPAELPALI